MTGVESKLGIIEFHAVPLEVREDEELDGFVDEYIGPVSAPRTESNIELSVDEGIDEVDI